MGAVSELLDVIVPYFFYQTVKALDGEKETANMDSVKIVADSSVCLAKELMEKYSYLVNVPTWLEVIERKGG